ncbi:MAG: hypothetical protein NTV46_02280 [Verrucomicrobia bacterium]|nr:hypothetical protein [Verrucomicrobiota bacterium]
MKKLFDLMFSLKGRISRKTFWIYYATAIFAATMLTAPQSLFGHEPESHQPINRPSAHEEIHGHVHAGWESKYFSEGRDSLDGDSLFASSLEIAWQHLTGGIWYGSSPDQRYDELQLTLALTQTIGDFEFYGRYTHLRFPFDDSHDNEIGAGIAWSGLPLDVELAADIYNSFDADGYFAEISATREFSITDELSINLSGLFGINQGYVCDGHDGANHAALRLGIGLALSDSLSIMAHATYSWGIGRDLTLPGDDQLIDFVHVGVGLQWSF